MPISKADLQHLYVINRKSMFEISLLLDCSVHKVEYWLKKYNIDRRSLSDANYAKYNPDGDPYNIKENLSLEEEKLLSLALGLYWGEGGKTNYQSARLTNSDPAMILAYYTFLIAICQIKPSKIHFHLQTFKDNDITYAKKFWAKKLNLSKSLINTSKPISSQGKGSYKRISKTGVMTVGVYNTHFRAWMMEQLTKLGYNPE